MAFGSTLAREQAFPDDVWHERAAGGASGADRVTFIAERHDRWVGADLARIYQSRDAESLAPL